VVKLGPGRNAVVNAKRFFLREARGSPGTACGAVAQRFYNEVSNSGQFDVLDELLAPDAVYRT